MAARAWMAATAAVLALAACERSHEQPEAVAGARATPTPADPVEAALRAAIDSPAQAAVYQAAAWKPVWDAGSARDLEHAIAARRAHGLDRLDFAAGDGAAGTPEAADVARTRAALAYAGALARGAADPTKLHAIYTLPRPTPDLAAELTAALRERRVADWLEELAPQDAAYRALSRAYLSARAGTPPAPAPVPTVTCVAVVPPPPPVPGPTPVAEPTPATAPIPDDPDRVAPPPPVPVPAVPDPAPTPEERCTTTMVAPPRPRGDMAPVLAVAMERLRWLERRPADTRIDVNIATARLTYWRGGGIADVRPVVVGATETRTPQLGSPMFRLVANPTWTIPASIVRKDRMARRSAASLARSGMAWKNGRIVQKPGPRNSLGLVKFDMRNGYAIYLHDTPAKGLFAAAERHRSHGCVRVKDALGFAAMLAADGGIGDAWARASARARTAYLPLPREIPVRLLYATVLLGENGVPVVRADPYGWDAPVAKRLGFGAIARPTVESEPIDSGP